MIDCTRLAVNEVGRVSKQTNPVSISKSKISLPPHEPNHGQKSHVRGKYSQQATNIEILQTNTVLHTFFAKQEQCDEKTTNSEKDVDAQYPQVEMINDMAQPS